LAENGRLGNDVDWYLGASDETWIAPNSSIVEMVDDDGWRLADSHARRTPRDEVIAEIVSATADVS
jgi:hypothetical protein